MNYCRIPVENGSLSLLLNIIQCLSVKILSNHHHISTDGRLTVISVTFTVKSINK